MSDVQLYVELTGGPKANDTKGQLNVQGPTAYRL